jgi:hypothetical protein
MDVRPYSSADRPACLAVFDSNTPRFFHPGERRNFETFLDAPFCSYLVVEHDIAGSKKTKIRKGFRQALPPNRSVERR